MPTIQTILAASDTDYSKIIFAVVFFVIWAVSQLVSMLAKKSQEQRRRQLEMQAKKGPLAPIPASRRTSPAPSRVSVPRQNPSIQKGSTTRKPVPAKVPKLKSSPRPVKLPPPVPSGAKSRALMPTAPAISPTGSAGAATQITATAAPIKRLPSATAPTLNTWLRPATLQQQFILTEIFQPPIALRPGSDDRR